MIIRSMSDLHLEFSPNLHLPYAGEDLIIFAGDIGIHTTGMKFAKKVAARLNTPAIYIAGNHEYYQISSLKLINHTWEGVPKDLSLEADSTSILQKGKVTYLENSTVIYKGVRFIGATLWTDMQFFGKNPLVKLRILQVMSDFRLIWSKNNNYPVTTEQVIARHEQSLSFIKKELAEPFNGRTVVITHHAPSALSVAEEFKDDYTTAAYCSRLENLIIDSEPVLWIHGHTHCHFDYQLGKTRIICNPRGYPFQYNSIGFNPEQIVKI